ASAMPVACPRHELRAFPTRRSSDLSGDRGDAGSLFDDGNEAPALGFGEGAGLLDANAVTDFGFALLVVRVELLIAGDDFFVFGRSEEHTSELQSLAYLVCALLLVAK